jgi:phage terminase large subunit-like protein
MLSPTEIPADKAAAILTSLEAEREQRRVENKLASYAPYPKQLAFHEAGNKYRERLLMASNRFGKTVCGAAEMAFHLTGQYPEWWQGKRFDKPVRAWAAGVTSETTRDVIQEKLLGPPFRESEWGTGMIPKSTLAGVVPARGVAGAIDTVTVRHVSGGHSTLQFKSYERGREKWMGAALEVVYLDEEPDASLYSEALTRTNETGGIVFCNFTPLLGVSEVVRRFLYDKSSLDRIVINATIDDVPHFSEADKQRIADSYSEHEREARLRGIPTMGSGRVFVHSEEKLLVDPFRKPTHWTVLGGLRMDTLRRVLRVVA